MGMQHNVSHAKMTKTLGPVLVPACRVQVQNAQQKVQEAFPLLSFLQGGLVIQP